jgi:trypsin
LSAVAALMVALPAAADARTPLSARIVNGTFVANPSPYPFMAGLVTPGAPSDWDGQFCGGSLQPSGRILTAAHCVLGSSPNEVSVLLGQTHLSQTGHAPLIAVTGISVDPNYDPETARNDAALLALASPASQSPIAPVQPGQPDDSLWDPGDPLKVIGWGATDPAGTMYPTDLKETTITRKDDSTCALDYQGFTGGFDANSGLCADGPGTDSCFGDSGGPLFSEAVSPPKQVGVVSFGSEVCADPTHPGVYTRLGAQAIHDFITSATPVIQPFATANPTVTPAPVVGQASSCPGAQFGGDPATRQEFAWGRKSGGTITQVGSDPTYTPTNADLGFQLVCAVAAFNAGGFGIAQSQPSPAVVAPPASSPSGTSTPTPTPTPTPTANDTSAPRAVPLTRTCARHRCTVVVAVTDAAPSAGIAGVSAKLDFPKTCGRTKAGRKRCKKPRAKTLAGKRTAPDRFTIKTGRLKRGRYKLSVSARDAAGNVQLVPTVISLTVR